MFRKVLLVALLLSVPIGVLPQNRLQPVTSDADEKREKQAVDLLRETMADVGLLRLSENRISFMSELATLMWYHDEREAKAMYGVVINDFRQLLAQLDLQMNAIEVKPDDDADTFGPMFVGEPTESQKIARKLRTAFGVRQAIATSIAEHDPELALSFFYDTGSTISNTELRKSLTLGDQNLEQHLVSKLAQIDPAKAVRMGKKSLEKGFNYSHVDLLKKLYEKDADKAIEYGDSILSRIKSERLDSLDLSAMSALLTFGAQNLDQSRTLNGKKAVYSDVELRDIAEVFAQAILARPADSVYNSGQYARELEKYQPGRALQIRTRGQTRSPGGRAGNGPPPMAVRGQGSSANANVGYGTGSGSASVSTAETTRLQREASEKKMMEDVNKIGGNKLTVEQRDKIIQQARKTIMSTPGRDKRVAGLNMLAAQVAKAGDKDLAGDIMRDAATFVNPQPKNYQEYMLSWMLAAGYASVDPERAFPVLDDTIGRANELIAASIMLAEFIDVNEDIIVDGELQVGAFGGSMVRGLTNELGMADSTLKQLAEADFQKTRDLANRFERPEVRVLAKMMVLRAVLGEKSKAKSDGK
jgi:hypothetical protein